uniref:C2H2-type domain-containing protein n=1 Tax=Eptatretus burgeri TaxID=7764 RepID=A0A8C4X1F8_EPTBU
MIGGKPWGNLPASDCSDVYQGGAEVSSTRRRSPWVNPRRFLQVGARNVLSQREDDHLSLLSSELKRLDNCITALSAVWRPDCANIMASGYTDYWSGRSEGYHAQGVAVAMSNKLTPLIVDVTPVNEHIMRLRICHSLGVISLVFVYNAFSGQGNGQQAVCHLDVESSSLTAMARMGNELDPHLGNGFEELPLVPSESTPMAHGYLRQQGKRPIGRPRKDDQLVFQDTRNWPLLCTQCGKGFASRSSLIIHMRSHTGEKPYPCKYCGRAFSSSSNLAAHEKRHMSGKMFTCRDCGKSFRTKSQLAVHCKCHFGEKRFHVRQRSRVFPTKSTLAEHKMHVPKTLNLCFICGKRVRCPSALSVHMRCHTGEKPFECKLCGRSFTLKSNLKRHHLVFQDTRNWPLLCTQCGKGFASRSSLIIHMRSHTGEKPYPCKYCGRAFSSSSNLAAHEKRHMSGKMFTCRDCGKSFRTKSQLAVHCKCHFGEKRFHVRQRSRVFPTKSTLAEHKMHVPKTLNLCFICGKRVRCPSALSVHMRCHTGEKPFECKLCGRSFTLKSNLKRHHVLHCKIK